MAATNLPRTMKALVLESTSKPLTVETIPTPKPTLGSAVVKILASNVISYSRDVLNGKRNYPFPMPLTPGFSGVARVADIGPDATKLKNGDLVFVDSVVRSRDDPTDSFLGGVHEGYTPGSKKLMKEIFRDWTYAEYANIPLENLTLFDENRLTGSASKGGLGYKVEELSAVATLLVPYGGLRDIDLQAGQTIIVAPATGPFGGAAVLVALAMGARVIAMGRNKASLQTVKDKVPNPERVETVPITGDMEADLAELKKFGQIDAFFDIGPPEAYKSTHLKSAMLALRHGARISLMGGYREDVAIPHVTLMHRNQRLYGKWMYERSDIADMFKLVEAGLLKLGEAGAQTLSGEFPLEQWQEAFDCAAEHALLGQHTILKP